MMKSFIFFCRTRYFSKNSPCIEKTTHVLLSNANIYFINMTDGVDFNDMVKVEFSFPLKKISCLSFGIFYQNFTLHFEPSDVFTIMSRDEAFTQRFVDDLMVSLQAVNIRPSILEEEDSTLDNFDSTVRSSEDYVDLSDVQSYLNCFRIGCENDKEPKSSPAVTLQENWNSDRDIENSSFSLVSSSLDFNYDDVDATAQPLHKSSPVKMKTSILKVSFWQSYQLKLHGSLLCCFSSKVDTIPKLCLELNDNTFSFAEVENPTVPFVFEISLKGKNYIFASKSKVDFEQWRLLFNVLFASRASRYVNHQSPVCLQGRRAWLLLYSDVILLANVYDSRSKCVVAYIIPVAAASIKMTSRQKRLNIEFLSHSVDVEFTTAEEKGVCMARISQAKSLELHEDSKFGVSAFEIETEIEHVSATLNNLRSQYSDSSLRSEARERLKKVSLVEGVFPA